MKPLGNLIKSGQEMATMTHPYLLQSNVRLPGIQMEQVSQERKGQRPRRKRFWPPAFPVMVNDQKHGQEGQPCRQRDSLPGRAEPLKQHVVREIQASFWPRGIVRLWAVFSGKGWEEPFAEVAETHLTVSPENCPLRRNQGKVHPGWHTPPIKA